MKYYQVTVSGPYVDSDEHYVAEVSDDFDPEGKDAKEAEMYQDEAVAQYVSAEPKLLDEEPDHPYESL